jgi:Tol biopolymer transport system component
VTPQPVIAHYRLGAKLGEGGMGAVYRATDTKLGREVAVKVLPDSFAADPDRLARFTREAQVLASLNHPNIAAIYGVEEKALILELVEGAAPAGPLGVEEALPIVHQLVDALEYAHEKGIVHRDLKPANLKVTPDGRLKVLDFGLAKALSTDIDLAASSPADSPTMTMRATMAGVIMGTAAYMSPEQARGHAVDKRADIWSFGVVLYELLTGKQLFGGDTVSDTLAAVLRHDPDVPAVPPRFQKLLRLCLTRDPRQRLRDISGARLLLDEAPAPAAVTARPQWPWIAALAVTAGVAAVGWWPRPQPAPAAAVHFTLPLPDGTVHSGSSAAAQVVPSPDGRHLAFVARDSKTGKTWLWLRPLNSRDARRLERTEDANFPFWSPDSQTIGFFAERKLKKIAITSGAPQTICGFEGRGDGAAWGEDGMIVFAAGQTSLQRVSAGGGPSTPATTLDAKTGEEFHSWPQFLPGGKRLLYFGGIRDGGEGGIYVQEPGSASRTKVIASYSRAAFAEGRLLFAREETLFAQRFNPETLRLEGEPSPVSEGVLENATNGRSPFSAAAGILASRHGAAVYAHQIRWRGPQGELLAAIGETIQMHGIAISPDQKRAAIVRHDKLYLDDVWLMDLATGVTTPVGVAKGRYRQPVWSPDSQRLALNRTGAGPVVRTLATGQEVPLPGSADLMIDDWTPDSRHLVATGPQGRSVFLVPAEATAGEVKATVLVDTPFLKQSLRISPDGRRVAFLSNESGPNELYAADFPAFTGKVRLSTGAALSPNWTPDGRSLIYYSASSLFRVDAAGGTPQELCKLGPMSASFAVARDGRLLVPERLETRLDDGFPIVLNWTAELKR